MFGAKDLVYFYLHWKVKCTVHLRQGWDMSVHSPQSLKKHKRTPSAFLFRAVISTPPVLSLPFSFTVLKAAQVLDSKWLILVLILEPQVCFPRINVHCPHGLSLGTQTSGLPIYCGSVHRHGNVSALQDIMGKGHLHLHH